MAADNNTSEIFTCVTFHLSSAHCRPGAALIQHRTRTPRLSIENHDGHQCASGQVRGEFLNDLSCAFVGFYLGINIL